MLMLRKQLEEIEEALINAKLAEQESKLAATKTSKPSYTSTAASDSFGDISDISPFGDDNLNLPKRLF